MKNFKGTLLIVHFQFKLKFIKFMEQRTNFEFRVYLGHIYAPFEIPTTSLTKLES